jgi:ABC-type polar amino acid transport system ATPase subunit
VLETILFLAESGMTMLCVTHEMCFARQMADRIVFLDGGEVVEDGSPATVFDTPKTARFRAFLGQMQGRMHED